MKLKKMIHCKKSKCFLSEIYGDNGIIISCDSKCYLSTLGADDVKNYKKKHFKEYKNCITDE